MPGTEPVLLVPASGLEDDGQGTLTGRDVGRRIIKFPVHSQPVLRQEAEASKDAEVGGWADVLKLPHGQLHRTLDVLNWYPLRTLVCDTSVVHQTAQVTQVSSP